MVKRDWNDINDEDSSISSQSQQEKVPKIEKKEPTFQTSINKVSRLKNASDERSLIKINKHSGRQVWLQITNSFYERADEVHQLLQANRQMIKIIRLKNIGWNVLVDKDVGKKLISQGYQKGNIFMKFIYSHKNEENTNGNTNQSKNTKGTKKVVYVEKLLKNDENQRKSTTFNQQITIGEQTVQKEDQQDNMNKKKAKWMQKPKSLSQMSSDEIKSPKIVKKNYDQIKKNLIIKESSPKIIKKYVQKTEFIEFKGMKSQNILHTQDKKIEDIIYDKSEVEENKKIQKKDQYNNNQITHVKSPNKQIILESRQSDSLEKELKKKKKKRNNKVPSSKIDKVENNPFSYFIK